jgi:predicted transcriptional regulator
MILVAGTNDQLTDHEKDEKEVYQFILEEIDSVPHLEALLLLWNTRPKAWSREELAERLYVKPSVVDALLQGLTQQGLVAHSGEAAKPYSYDSRSPERNLLIGRLDDIYRKQIVTISTLIHAKPSSSLRDFARAFRFTKERE